jgi:AbrB family looped-hinge helix DNA binding protein
VGKVTSKLQVTVPKAVADHFAIRPGDEVEWTIAGDVIRVVPHAPRQAPSSPQDTARRLALFDAATSRQKARQRAAAKSGSRATPRSPATRGWTREELYERGSTR